MLPDIYKVPGLKARSTQFPRLCDKAYQWSAQYKENNPKQHNENLWHDEGDDQYDQSFSYLSLTKLLSLQESFEHELSKYWIACVEEMPRRLKNVYQSRTRVDFVKCLIPGSYHDT